MAAIIGIFIVLNLSVIVLLIHIYRKQSALIQRCTYPVKATVVGIKEDHHSSSSAGSSSYIDYIEQVHYVCGIEEYTVNGRRSKRKSNLGAVGSIVEIKVNPSNYSEYVAPGEDQNLIWILFGIGMFIFVDVILLLILILCLVFG